MPAFGIMWEGRVCDDAEDPWIRIESPAGLWPHHCSETRCEHCNEPPVSPHHGAKSHNSNVWLGKIQGRCRVCFDGTVQEMQQWLAAHELHGPAKPDGQFKLGADRQDKWSRDPG